VVIHGNISQEIQPKVVAIFAHEKFTEDGVHEEKVGYREKVGRELERRERVGGRDTTERQPKAIVSNLACSSSSSAKPKDKPSITNPNMTNIK